MLADLDESLRALLGRELAGHGFKELDIAFDPPAATWSSKRTTPTLNLFLYDLHESTEKRPVDWETRRENGRTHEVRPPLRVDASYVVTAWAKTIGDEHRILSQVLATLHVYRELPQDVLAGGLGDEAALRHPPSATICRTRPDSRTDFWAAFGLWKVSLDYVVTLSWETGGSFERGPAVRTQTVRMRDARGGSATMLELHRLGGTVRDADGAPVPDAWVMLADSGASTTSGEDGRFRFDSLRAGSYRCLTRGPDGATAETELTVPGIADVVLGQRAKSRRGRS